MAVADHSVQFPCILGSGVVGWGGGLRKGGLIRTGFLGKKAADNSKNGKLVHSHSTF